ncbi:MAG TPA: 4Fe-4S binding protein, partial [Candidatus Aphodomonas merdavium]|nr:4Fe-4S binding protein [Candidatus Aphodomonas merdavium]
VNTGIAEVPMGCSLRDLVYKVGGGLPKGMHFKAVQLGGPSGGCITAMHLDTPVTYEALTALGAIMGSGGAIVMSENTCMVDTARFFLDFIQDESCGKCVPCRIGTRRMLDILHRITGGRGTMQDLEDLEALSYNIRDCAMCGLGQTAPNPVLSTLKYFRQEYIDHIQNHRCAALVCSALVHYRIDPDKCKGCTMCKRNCPTGAILGEVRQTHMINESVCISCGVCAQNCKFGAISRYSGD